MDSEQKKNEDTEETPEPTDGVPEDGVPDGNDDSGEKQPKLELVEKEASADGEEISKARTAVLILVDQNGNLLYTPDVPMELEKKATPNDVEVMLIQALEAVRMQKLSGMVAQIVRREIAQAAPHLADNVVNSLHKKAVQEARKPGLVVPR
jgi:hypothetical protein